QWKRLPHSHPRRDPADRQRAADRRTLLPLSGERSFSPNKWHRSQRDLCHFVFWLTRDERGRWWSPRVTIGGTRARRVLCRSWPSGDSGRDLRERGMGEAPPTL